MLNYFIKKFWVLGSIFSVYKFAKRFELNGIINTMPRSGTHYTQCIILSNFSEKKEIIHRYSDSKYRFFSLDSRNLIELGLNANYLPIAVTHDPIFIKKNLRKFFRKCPQVLLVRHPLYAVKSLTLKFLADRGDKIPPEISLENLKLIKYLLNELFRFMYYWDNKILYGTENLLKFTYDDLVSEPANVVNKIMMHFGYSSNLDRYREIIPYLTKENTIEILKLDASKVETWTRAPSDDIKPKWDDKLIKEIENIIKKKKIKLKSNFFRDLIV